MIAVADPDIQISGGGGHPDHETRGMPGLQRIFLALRSSVWSKDNGGTAPPLDTPLDRMSLVI